MNSTNNVYRKLNIPDIFVPCFKHKIINETIEGKLLLDDINAEFKDWLAELNIGLHSCRFFNALPNAKYSLHRDIGHDSEVNKSITDCVKINIVYNAVDSKMVWYSPNPGTSPILVKNKVGEGLNIYKEENCTPLFTVDVTGPSLINGMVIHTLINGSTTRQCYSMPLINLTTGKRLTWDEATTILASYIVN